jgi:RNA polymerase subunit RPABC4/transcription elongation factor Spt4
MFAFAGIFGITNHTIAKVVLFVVLFLAVIWLSLIVWTFTDARRRISDPVLVFCAVVASLFPFIGTLVYTIVRPPEYLEDRHERDLEIRAAEATIASAGGHLCPHCDYHVQTDWLRCPNCMRKLKEPCTNCGKPLDPQWNLCPYCEAQVGQQQQPAARRTRRRRDPEATSSSDRY